MPIVIVVATIVVIVVLVVTHSVAFIAGADKERARLRDEKDNRKRQNTE